MRSRKFYRIMDLGREGTNCRYNRRGYVRRKQIPDVVNLTPKLRFEPGGAGTFAVVLGLILISVYFPNSLAQSTPNPVPFINQPLVPDAAIPGGTTFTLTVNGTSFAAGAVANWNGSPRATTFVSSSQLTVSIAASGIATAIKRTGTATSVKAGKTLRDAVLAARGRVVVSPGVYVLTSTIKISTQSLVIECASGAIIAGASASVSPLIKLDAPHTSVRGCQFQGQAIDGTTRQLAVEIGVVNNASVIDNLITGEDSSHGFNNGVQIDTGASGSWIERNTIQQLFGTASGVGYGILLITTSGNHVDHNRILFSTTQGRHQIYVSQNSSNNSLTANILKGGTSSMISVFARDSQGDGARYNRIYDNILRNGGNAIGGTGAIGLFNNVHYCSVVNNVIDGTARAPGIELWDAGGKTKLPNHNTIANNKIDNTGTFGIEVVGASRNKISGNRIYNSSTLTPNTYDSILIAGDGGSLRADGNQVTNNSTGGSSRYSLNILSTVPRVIATSVTGNALSGGLAGSYKDSGAKTVSSGNLTMDHSSP